MSASYTLHVAPHAVPGDPGALGRATLVRDGFAFWAFVAPPLWFLANRHWLVGVAVAVALGAFWAVLHLLGLPGGAALLLNLLLWFLVGLEASSIRRWDLAREGRPAVDVVFAASEADAETKTFARWLAADALPTPPPIPVRTVSSPWGIRDEPHVIGLFPDTERRR